MRVEPLARELGVTKGSFYWHFKDRADLLAAIVEFWEQSGTLAVIRHVDQAAADPRERLKELWRMADDDRLEIELAIRLHADSDDRTRAAVTRVDAQRMEYLRRNFREMGLSIRESESRSMLFYSLLIGDFFISESHGPLTRRGVLDDSVDLLLRGALDASPQDEA